MRRLNLNLTPDIRTLSSRIGSPPSGTASVPGGLPKGLRRPRAVFRAIAILASVVAATLVRSWLGREFGVTAPYLTYFPAVLIVASFFGIADGICATVVATVFVDYFFLSPVDSIVLANMGDRVAIVFFFFACIALSVVAGALRSRTWRMLQALEELRATQGRISEEQRRLQETNIRLDTIVGSADEAIIGKDIHGIVTSWNHGAERIFGYTAPEMIGQHIRRLLPVGKESEEDDILARVLRGETFEKLDAERIAKDGRTVHLNLTVSPIRDAEGNIIGASKVARDITEQLKLQKQLQQAQKMEAVGQLAGGIAHDFNNLLAIILGALELQLPSLAGNAEAAQRWEVANRAAVRGAELTRRLLAFSSQEHFKIAPTDLNHSVRNTMEMAQRLIGPEIKVNLDLEGSMSRILVDPSGLESAILNLVINARDAMMPRGGSLTVSTRTADLEEELTATLTGNIRPGTYACICITDTGCGMSAEVLDRACEPFFTTKERGRGTGLGLSMVYGFVKHSGGGIRIYSEVGCGTTITFYLPFDSARVSVLAARPQEDKFPQLRRSGRILIVDDESELLDISISYLTARGYTALRASGADEALRTLTDKGPVDVLITDIVMGGGMDGMELAQAVHRLYPQTRVVYSSGFPADALSERSLPLADSLVLQKPYRLSELGASIDQALGIRQILSGATLAHTSPAAEDAFTAPASPTPLN